MAIDPQARASEINDEGSASDSNVTGSATGNERASTHSLYRKWRSQTFGELVGQEPVTRTLKNAVRTGRLAHAYVFSGPRGVGKTSAARLLAKAVNCLNPKDGEPCNQCSSCLAIVENRSLDVVEIDAASNNGVDQIRSLIEKVAFRPSESRYKFYILDEAHMLTGAAANAFLKTLEEPPSQTIFVLATTELQRLPATILSRCQRLEFRRVSLGAMLERLREIARGEGITIEESALELIANAATGSLRDAQSLLEQVIAYAGRDITVAQVREAVGLAGGDAAFRLLDSIATADVAAGLRLINELVERGAEPTQFVREIIDFLRGVMLLQAGGELGDLIEATTETRARMATLARQLTPTQVLRVLRVFTWPDSAPRGVNLGQLPLEMAFVEATLEVAGKLAPPAAPSEPPALARPQAQSPRRFGEIVESSREASLQRHVERPEIPKPQPVVIEPIIAPTVDPLTEGIEATDEPQGETAPTEPSIVSFDLAKSETIAEKPAVAPGPTLADVQSRWAEVVRQSGAANRSLRALLLDTRPIEIRGNSVILGCRYRFHQEKLSQDANRATIEDAFKVVFGLRLRIQCVVDGERPKEGDQPADPFEKVMTDPLVRGAVSMGYRVNRIVSGEEVVYDAQSENDPATPG